MIFKSNNGKSFSLKEAIDLMVSLSATDANSAKNGKVSINFYRRLTYKKNGTSIGKLNVIKMCRVLSNSLSNDIRQSSPLLESPILRMNNKIFSIPVLICNSLCKSFLHTFRYGTSFYNYP